MTDVTVEVLTHEQAADRRDKIYAFVDDVGKFRRRGEAYDLDADELVMYDELLMLDYLLGE